MKIVKYADGATSRPSEKLLILNSAQTFKGGVVKLSPGGVDGADAVSDVVYGIVKGFVINDGNTPIENALSTAYDGTWTASSGRYAAASDNQTAEMVKAVVEPILPGDVVRAEMDAALGTTTGSNLIGYYVSVLTTDERKLDESTTSTSVQQFLIVGQPNVGKFVDVKLVEGQLTGAIDAGHTHA